MRAAVAGVRKPRQPAGRPLSVGENDVANDPPGPPRVPGQDNERRTGLAQVRRASGGARRRSLLIVLGACLCLAMVGASAALLSSPGGQSRQTAVGIGSPATGKNPAARSAPATSPSHAPAAPARTPAVTGHSLAKTALRLPSGLKSQARGWTAGPGGAALSAVTQHMGAAAQSAGLRLYAQMRLACVSLDASIQAARAAPPIPDVAMQGLYGQALAELSGAAADCQQAISEKPQGVEDTAVHEDNALLNRSRSEFAAGVSRSSTRQLPPSRLCVTSDIAARSCGPGVCMVPQPVTPAPQNWAEELLETLPLLAAGRAAAFGLRSPAATLIRSARSWPLNGVSGEGGLRIWPSGDVHGIRDRRGSAAGAQDRLATALRPLLRSWAHARCDRREVGANVAGQSVIVARHPGTACEVSFVAGDRLC